MHILLLIDGNKLRNRIGKYACRLERSLPDDRSRAAATKTAGGRPARNVLEEYDCHEL